MQTKLIDLFEKVYGRAPEIITRAPGRVELIGNHTDYNGGTVLGAAIDRGVWVGLARRTDRQRRFYSEVLPQIVTLTGEPQRVSGGHSWVNYPLGVLAALEAFGKKAPEGFDYGAVSNLPAGAGLSSSAAIELASALAFLAATGETADREAVVKIARHAENHFVGVPCGILDQGVSGFGKKGRLVFIDCLGPTFATVPMPEEGHFWIFNTHTKHALVDGLYEARHRECMEAAKVLGVEWLVQASGVAVEARRGELSDVAYRRAKHVVEENARVEEAKTALAAGELVAVGVALTASHRSSQHLFENSTAELDFLVDTLTVTPGVYGARLTGGGFGGAVLALTRPEFDAGAARVAEIYAGRFGAAPEVLSMLTGEGAEVIAG